MRDFEFDPHHVTLGAGAGVFALGAELLSGLWGHQPSAVDLYAAARWRSIALQHGARAKAAARLDARDAAVARRIARLAQRV